MPPFDIANLGELVWRFIVVPAESLPVSFSHQQAERRYPYRDGASHDHTGRGPLELRARLFFLASLDPALFPGRFNEWVQATVFDGSPGPLFHPVMGIMDARVQQGSIDMSARTRDGVIVDCTWVESVEVEEPYQPLASGEELAATADRYMEIAGIPYPTGEATMSLLDAFNSIKGQIGMAVARVAGAINQALAIVNNLIDTFTTLDDPALAPGRTALLGLRNQYLELQRMNERMRPRAVRSVVVTSRTTLDAFAAEVRNTVEEIMSLNPGALRSPSVPAGSRLSFYA